MKTDPKNRRVILIVAGICAFVVLLVCGMLWRYWFGPRQMFVAIARGDTSQAQKLMRLGVSPNVDVFLIGGLVHCAAARGQVQMMEILRRSGADINRIDGWGDSPAHSAVESHQLSAFQWLIAHGADISCTNRHGMTVQQFITNEIPEPEQDKFLSVITDKSQERGNSMN